MKTLKDKIYAGMIVLIAIALAYGSYDSFQKEAKKGGSGSDEFDSFEYKEF